MMKYSNKNGGFAIGLVVLAIAALSVLGIVEVKKHMVVKIPEVKVDNVVGSGGRTVTASVVNLGSGVTGTLPIANGGTNGTSYLAPLGNINPIVYYDGTKLTTNANALDIGYDAVADLVYSAGLRIAASGTTVATFTNTGAQSTTGGAGMIGYANPGAAVTSGNRLGFYLMGGAVDTASTTANSVGIAGFATENFSSTNQGGRVDVVTTPNGSTAASARRTIATFDQSGNVGVGTTTPSEMLSVAGTGLFNNVQATSTTEVSSFVGVKAGTKVNTDGATITVDWLQGPTQEVVLGATGRTLAFSNVQAGAALKLWVWQDGTGSRTITTYPTGTHWAGGSAPTLTTTANKFDILVFTTASSTTQFSAGASLNY